jgi:DNA (cytosine-5)-methyltransferase 1
MKHLGDITKIHGDQIEPVDCITFGSPCQDLSIAGRRAGLAGERSGLFMEAVRIIKEMRSSTNGLLPTFAIWENVPGAFSSNGGEDFRAVLEELARVEQPDVSIPRPSKGKWSKAGAISGDGWSLAWRQLDSQYFGVAQRRKRIALIIDLGGQRAGEILFERTSLSRYPDPCIPTWQETTGAAGNSHTGNDRMVGQQGGQAYTLKIRSGCAGGGKGALVQTEKTGTLSTLQDRTLFQAIPVLNDQGGGAMSVSYNMTGTLRAAEHGHQPIVLESNQIHATVSQTGICPTLPASMGMGGGYIPMITDRKVFDARGNGDGKIVPTITGDPQSRITDYTAIANECMIAEKTIRLIVRRLTPVECERLQGYPDGWTDIGEWTDTKGKKHKYADSPRYKALGNSIALPQWFWIAQKMKPYLSTSATLGSLFDGIGGFPLVWQKAYGNGTARWASEIDEFPIAVTKRRFGEE